MTVTVVVDGKVWLQRDDVTDIIVEDGRLTVFVNDKAYTVKMKRVNSILATSY